MKPPDLSGLRIGYAPISRSLQAPGDRRRFVRYAEARGLAFELADPAKAYDLVVLSERADISVWSRYRGGRIVFDLIDSYLAIPRIDVKAQLRGLAKFVSGEHRRLELDYWRALAEMCARADAVICATQEQKADIGRYNANVHIILDVHAQVAQRPKRDFAAHEPFRLVWEGLPQNLSTLAAIAPVLRELDRRRPIELRLVTDLVTPRYLGRIGRRETARQARRLFHRTRVHPWRERDWADVVAACDLALIPLETRDPFLAGKPENKLLLFWRMGMPTLSSATPAYRRAMDLAGLPMACTGPNDWAERLWAYMADEALRRDAGARGLACAERCYSEAKTLSDWDALFASIVARAPKVAA